MNNASKYTFKVTVISAAVATLFMAGTVYADDEELKALTQPQSSVQVEAISVSTSSAKFGEYNGLNKMGNYPNGALSIKGGSGYTNNEQGETTRWSVTGDNLGLTTRSAGAEISNQGSWSLGVGFDQLQHNISDDYQTPYQGKMGGNSFTLPSNLQGNITSTTSSNTLNSLSEMGISTTRNNTTLKGQAIVDKDLNFTFEYNNLTQTGAKLQAFGGAGWASANAIGTTPARPAYNANGATSYGYGQTVSILPTPINYQTDTVNLAANWKSENAHITTSYFGSFFQNTNKGFNWQPFSVTSAAGAGPSPVETMSLAPSNAFNQLNVAGGYDFTKQTKLTGNVSVGQNTQNSGYAYDSQMMQTPSPTASMNGLVNTTHADLKITDQTVKDLVLTAAAKYDNRDNLTQSNMYSQYAIGGTNGYVANAPMSIKQAQLLLSGAYKISKDQRAELSLSQNNINRWCNQYGTTSTANIVNSTGVGFLNTSNCTSATASQENKVDANYKIKATEDVNIKFGAGYSNRKTQWDQTALTEMPGPSSSQTSTTPGYNGGNYNGFMPFFEASRKQFVGKANANWQATEQLGFNLGGKYTNDTYPDSTYGVQNGYSWSLNLDGTYAYAEGGNVSAYATQQNMQRSLNDFINSNYSPSGSGRNAYNGGWSNTLTTNATTLGLAAKQSGFLSGKLTLNGDATFSFASSNYGTQVNYTPYTSVSGVTGGVPGCGAAVSMTCGSLPAIKNNMAAIKLGGMYQVDKNSRVGLQYWFQRLYSNDYFYNGYQAGTNPSAVMPTQQSNPSYNVNVISANYTYTFD
jgi:MtrB/PioB family decaheme-associated outer membrane protein